MSRAGGVAGTGSAPRLQRGLWKRVRGWVVALLVEAGLPA